MSQNPHRTPEPGQTPPHIPSTTEDAAVVAVADEQSPALADQETVSAPRRFINVLHKVRHELGHDMGHVISLVALHIIALGILEKTPLLVLFTLR